MVQTIYQAHGHENSRSHFFGTIASQPCEHEQCCDSRVLDDQSILPNRFEQLQRILLGHLRLHCLMCNHWRKIGFVAIVQTCLFNTDLVEFGVNSKQIAGHRQCLTLGIR